MGDWCWEPELGSAELECPFIRRLEFFRQLFRGLTKHPTAPSLRRVDLSTTVFDKYDLSLVDSLERLQATSKPYRIYKIRRMVIVMVMRNSHDFCSVCRFLDPLSG